MATTAISIASTALANTYVDESDAKTIPIVVTIFFFLGVVLSCMWLCVNQENRKRFGKAIYIAMAIFFGATFISDIVALSIWADVQLDSLWEYPKDVTIAHFVMTMLASLLLGIGCAFVPKCVAA